MNSPRFHLAAFGGAALSIAFTLPVLAADKCSMYGPGFTSVEGSDTCIQIGGRLRVEATNGGVAPANNGWANGSARPASLHTESAVNGADFGRSHLRLPQGALGYAGQ